MITKQEIEELEKKIEFLENELASHSHPMPYVPYYPAQPIEPIHPVTNPNPLDPPYRVTN